MYRPRDHQFSSGRVFWLSLGVLDWDEVIKKVCNTKK